MNYSRLFLSFSLACITSSALSATWIEGSGNVGDASAAIPGQLTIGEAGVGLTSIQGRFEFDDVDIYKIRITNVAAFRATTVGLAGTLDTQLFLFSEAGVGITHNDDDPVTNSIQSTITGQFVPGPGVYYLAVTQYNRDAMADGVGLFLWQNTPFNVERAPDGPGAGNAFANWSIEALIDGTYEVQLDGAEFAEFGTTPPPPQENIWVETTDAPALLPGQTTYGEGMIVRIDGTLSSFNDVDIYALNVEFPVQFHASTVGQIDFDSQLYLFDANGRGVVFNDDDPAITGSWSKLTSSHVVVPGTYYLAITKWDQDPRSSSGDIWLDEPSTTERIPDGAGAPNPLISWNNQGIGRSGAYSIIVRGAKFSAEGFTLSPLQTFNLTRGVNVSGGVSEMSQSDKAYGVFGPGIVVVTTQDPLVIECIAALPTSSPQTLELLVESRGTSAAIRQLVEVWDFIAAQWVQVDTSQLPAVGPDLTLTLNLISIPNVIGPDNKVRARLSYRATGPVFTYPWRVSIDQVAWRLQTN